jgi:hypothetical protein
MRHEFERPTNREPAGGAAQTDPHRFRRRPFGREGIARDNADSGRTHVTHKGGAGPGVRQRHPKVEADGIRTVAARRQGRGRQPLTLNRYQGFGGVQADKDAAASWLSRRALVPLQDRLFIAPGARPATCQVMSAASAANGGGPLVGRKP